MDAWQVTFAILMGFSLAATCGLRAFLPLLIIGIAAKAGFLHLAQGFEWMMSWPALICFGCATVLEILGDKIPAVDHVLDAAGVFVRPVAGAVAASSLIKGVDPLLAMVIGIIMGAAIAGIVQTVKGALRLLSSGLTGGVANPAVSTVEDTAAAVAGVAALFVPYITAALILIALVFGSRFMLSRLRRR
jgi:hypothetical protein